MKTVNTHRHRRAGWERAAIRRRLSLVLLIGITCVIAVSHMADVLPNRGNTRLEQVILAIFGALFSWISIGFWEAMAGVWTLVRRYDGYATIRVSEVDSAVWDPGARTAVLIPISNEDVDRVFSGLRATYESLERTGRLGHFDFFVLSDSNDPDKWVREEAAWADMCLEKGAAGRLFYRHRSVNIKRKSGNIADFCRRWGADYRYMIVLDADSVMAGVMMVQLVRTMEGRPEIGILQTAPRAVNQETLIARIQQFANHVYGPLFSAGLHFLQLGDSHFWGHNAILRTAPFMRHCGLPELPGRPPRGGCILSHDFVEAAFMRRGGWEVWLAYGAEGSYEEVPPTLLDELKRDRRWCQGNFQHIRLLFTRGLFTVHRALFLHGAMAYGSSLLWMLFLGLCSAAAILEAFEMPVYFPHEHALFPSWPVWYPHWAMALLSMTAVLLFLPKLLGILLIAASPRRARPYGGAGKLAAGLSVEVAFSALLAPIRMLFHTRFVVLTLLGRQVGWHAQARSGAGTGWKEAFRAHSGGMLLALIWGTALLIFSPSFFGWNAPIIIPLLLSAPLSVWTGSARAGRFFRRLGLLVIPEELDPPPELRTLREERPDAGDESAPFRISREQGFALAAVDPNINALHRALLRKPRKTSPSIQRRRQALTEKAIARGPDGLNAREKRELLRDPECMLDLHRRIWEIQDGRLAAMWGLTS